MKIVSIWINSFKEIKYNDEHLYMAWHRPDHRILKFSAPFFTDRFNGMNWVIFTENESMSWINNELSFGPGISQKEAEAYDEKRITGPPLGDLA